MSIYAETPPRSLRKLGSFDFSPEQSVQEIDAWLLAGETIRPDAARLFRSRPPNHQNPLATAEGAPGVAFAWMEVQGPIVEEWPTAGHKLLFGDLALKDLPENVTTNRAGAVRRTPGGVEIVAPQSDEAVLRLMRGFMQQAYRRPVREGEVERFTGLVTHARKNGHSFTDSLIAGYTGVLSSPEFLYFGGMAGSLDDYALSEQLSYFLWNSAPDAELLALAKRAALRSALSEQTERLLNDPRANRFVAAFLDYWLDLRMIAGTAPDEMLYPDYQLDDLLAESMIEETQSFFAELIKENLGARNVVASDFVMINERLATHYGIPDVNGVSIRRVPLPKESLRGGLLTQASVLKVTANGTTTSPVKRGAWILSRILGQPPSPPPPGTPAIEPDIRGATTIREQLALHRSQESCNSCHRTMDPPGFALESFDVMGGWRERYRAASGTEKVKGIGHNGNYFQFSLGPKVDASGEMADGQKFEDVRQLKECLAADEKQLARNLAQQLAVYATGAPIRFSDRPQIEKILAKASPSGYGVRTLIHELVQSELFLNK